LKLAFKILVMLVLGCLAAQAADLAILRNGNSIRHVRREVVGSVTRLYLSDAASGYIEIPTEQIERFEKDAAPAPLRSHPGSSAAAPPTVPAQTTAISRQALSDLINGAGERHQIDPDFINSVIRAESGFHQNAVSNKGAQGLMQLMPSTSSQLGVRNPFDPHANVEGGTTYLRELLEKYNYDVPKALAAYNAGPKRVDQYRGVPPYYETQTYIARIIRDYNRQKLAENPSLANKLKTRSVHASSRSAKLASPSKAQKTTIANAAPASQQPVSK
jgi:soluble lytic murein transglycosylase-like protein